MKTGAITVVAVAFLLLVSGGCGGSDGTGATTDQAGSAASTSASTASQPDSASNESDSAADRAGSGSGRKAFIARVDAVCKAGKARIESATTRFVKARNVNTSNPTKAQNEDLLAEVIGPDLQRQAEEISRLTAPPGDEQEIGTLVDAIEAGVREFERDPGSAVEGRDPLARAVRLAEEYGIEGCSNSE